ncbi:MAG TPA: DJ-1/PfpI family protein [Solirubrobacterales bacterium]|nr:DJ-1/PfpI family protein [Solirubrobacterales bacterium]
MQIAIPIYDGFTALDAIGPYDVLQQMPDSEVVFCAPEARVHRTESDALGVCADRSFDEVGSPEIVVVPGGLGNRRWIEGPNAYTEWLASVHEGTRFTTSVCTGSLLLAAAGLLDGVDAATHWAARDVLAGLGANPVAERVVTRGKIVTAAGVSSGIDMALRLVEEIHGETAAQAVQLAIEYDPDPPHDTGSLEKAGEELAGFVREAMGVADEKTAERLGIG